jgi:hypothetical protein
VEEWYTKQMEDVKEAMELKGLKKESSMAKQCGRRLGSEKQ